MTSTEPRSSFSRLIGHGHRRGRRPPRVPRVADLEADPVRADERGDLVEDDARSDLRGAVVPVVDQLLALRVRGRGAVEQQVQVAGVRAGVEGRCRGPVLVAQEDLGLQQAVGRLGGSGVPPVSDHTLPDPLPRSGSACWSCTGTGAAIPPPVGHAVDQDHLVAPRRRGSTPSCSASAAPGGGPRLGLCPQLGAAPRRRRCPGSSAGAARSARCLPLTGPDASTVWNTRS